MSKPIMDYLGEFLEFETLRGTILENIIAYFNAIKGEPGMSQVCGEVNPCDNSIEVKLFDFNILIKVDLCVSKSVGLIKWYDVKLISDKEKCMTLMIKDTFDRTGVVTTSNTPKIQYDVRKLVNYCLDTLTQYLERVDEMEFGEKVF